jgi:hypothetical protein
MAGNPSTEAAATQRLSGYLADTWINVRLEPLTKLWQGVGGASNFFLSEEDAREARGAYVESKPYVFAETLWRLAQASPNRTLGFRGEIREYVVDLVTPAAIGICAANSALGSGSVLQYYVPNWQRTLHLTGRQHKFAAASFAAPASPRRR